MTSKITKSSGSVFADLGVRKARDHELKAELVRKIAAMLREQGLTQTEAARHLQIAQPDVSRMLRGHFRQFSVERFMRFLVSPGTGRRNRCPSIKFAFGSNKGWPLDRDIRRLSIGGKPLGDDVRQELVLDGRIWSLRTSLRFLRRLISSWSDVDDTSSATIWASRSRCSTLSRDSCSRSSRSSGRCIGPVGPPPGSRLHYTTACAHT